VKITLELDSEGLMAINGQMVTLDQLDAYLVAQKNKTQSKTIVIRADQETKHGDVLKMMKLAKAVGIETISMAVEDLNLREASAKN
jgi:biopolymer transport protein ExbD